MINVSVWKLSLLIPTLSPCRGPAIQPGHPPLRPGTYCEGCAAAPAASRKTVVTTPTRPSAPSARRARLPLCTLLDEPIPAAAPAARGGRAVGVADCICPLLRLGDLPVFDVLGKLR